ncbi:Hepatocyte nuclear factor 6 [Chelonia mydas]|uniref:Hepatocyte nuclear factor 6 n=1 Tax=Chelonia mydas TaxID=8469 RepID=M7CDT1_CHEMY|nr:Hepatocyte nuclear factor 6 [Chelonia mydas]
MRFAPWNGEATLTYHEALEVCGMPGNCEVPLCWFRTPAASSQLPVLRIIPGRTHTQLLRIIPGRTRTQMPRITPACKRKEQEHGKDRGNTPKKPRLVFTDVQRRTLHAIFKENKRPSKELQITISQQLGLELSTVSNFFMNARRRSLDKWQDEGSSNSGNSSSSSSTCTKA